MKTIFICILLFGIFAFLIGPTLLAQKKCYDTAQTDVSEINSNVMIRGWNPKQVCERRFTILSDLESCVHDPNDTSTLTKYKELIAGILIPYIRPLTNSVSQQQSQHDDDCSEFSTLLFSEPQ